VRASEFTLAVLPKASPKPRTSYSTPSGPHLRTHAVVYRFDQRVTWSVEVNGPPWTE
jgi:hypothetical protein